MDIAKILEDEFKIKKSQVENTVKLIDDGNTIPFIARYRKEMTGALDDQVLRQIFERLTYLRNLEQQKEKVKQAIEEQGKLTDEIIQSLESSTTLTEVEDIYRPYRPKRKTRASIAKAKGLNPLAEYIYSQTPGGEAIENEAAKYINEELGVTSVQEALSGAKDIIAELISNDAQTRKRLRYVCTHNGVITSKACNEDMGVYDVYKDFSERIDKIAGYKVLAINRGEKEGYLKVAVEFDAAKANNILRSIHIKEKSPYEECMQEIIDDSYNRLIFPSIEREIRNELTEKADNEAIKVFADNTRQLLMQPPVKDKVTLGLDPGYRTGCKVAVVDSTGKLLDTGVIYPVPPHNKIEQAKTIVKDMINKYNVEVIAIGNGTASHETEVFASELIKEIDKKVAYMVVSEAGASVYSASKLAAEEFPEYDVSLRSAVSIARRLQDPLAELVKIDPKAIGVGQYQHDMPQSQLSEALDGVVEDCVNNVGVDLNTASVQLLCRVSGINKTVAKNIIKYREENGMFKSRSKLKEVPKLGPKAFEQCAGFLRVLESNEFLDKTAVHPESYKAAKKLLEICDIQVKSKDFSGIKEIGEKASKIGIESLSKDIGVGVPTLNDIISELNKPARDPREALPKPMLRTDIMGMEDLKAGMNLKGTVRNVVDFGAFVDIGVHQDGLLHISKISKQRIKHPSEVLRVGDIIDVEVLEVDNDKKRISLSLK